MSETQKSKNLTIRQRQYTYYEMLAWGQYYASHRNESSPEILLASFLRWKNVDGEFSLEARKILIIEEAVCRYYGISIADLRSGRRYKELTLARFVISYIAVTVGKCAQRKIAQILVTKRDNIQYQKTKCEEIISVDKHIRRQVDELVALLSGRIRDLDDQIALLVSEAKIPQEAKEVRNE